MQSDNGAEIVRRAEILPQEITDELAVLRKLAAATRGMRKAQRTYFSLRSGNNLAIAKRTESAVDGILDEFDKIKARKRPAAQAALF